MWNKDRSTLLSVIIIKICYGLLAACCIAAPWIVGMYDKTYITYAGLPSLFAALLVTLYVAAVPALAAVICLDRLLGNIRKGEPFITKNVTCLRVISYCCFAESLIFIYFATQRTFAWFVVIAFAFMGLILRVVKNVFQQAVSIREENDFTI